MIIWKAIALHHTTGNFIESDNKSCLLWTRSWDVRSSGLNEMNCHKNHCNVSVKYRLTFQRNQVFTENMEEKKKKKKCLHLNFQHTGYILNFSRWCKERTKVPNYTIGFIWMHEMNKVSGFVNLCFTHEPKKKTPKPCFIK